MNLRPDGDGAELRVRELETMEPFSRLGGAFAQEAREYARGASAHADNPYEAGRMIGMAEGLTEAAKRILTLAESHLT